MIISRILGRNSQFNFFWLLLALCGVNLYVMHIYILHNCQFDALLDATSYVDNFLGVSIDVIFLFLFFLIVTIYRIKVAVTCCFLVTWAWAMANILYSRFFYHYISYSAIGQGNALLDDIVIDSVWDKIYIVDFSYLLLPLLFLYVIKRVRVSDRNCVRNVLLCLLAVVVLDIMGHAVFCVSSPSTRYVSYFLHRIESFHLGSSITSSQPIFSNFIRGSVRSLSSDAYFDLHGRIDLTEEQQKTIREMLESSNACHVRGISDNSDKNIIFILVESYMSFTSDMKVNNREVTPFLNSLKCDSSVYYNGNMKENVTIGESSDGQFIYMTGLLPLRSVVTVSKAKKSTLPGLPQILRRNSRMIIPTAASMWNQDDMCRQYGFDKLYTCKDYEGGAYGSLTDEQVFRLAMEIDKGSKLPFFSVILTLSMHQPYASQIDSTFPISDPLLSDELSCYLNACHYTDKQIKSYFEFLKQNGLYENSVIFIVADHPVHNTDFGGVNKHIPLYIVNANIKYEELWRGEFNQVDVYPTLLDMLGADSNWRGVGCSLFSKTYKNVVDEKKWDVSEWIILGDYFSRK